MTRCPLCIAAFVVLSAAAGCGGAAPAPAPLQPTTATPPPPWGPDSARTRYLRVPVRFGAYQVLLPDGYEELPGPPGAKASPDRLVANWASPTKKAFLNTSVMTGPRAVAEVADRRQSLVNFTGGASDAAGDGRPARGPTESGTIAGLAFTRLAWNARSATGAPRGLAYVAVDGDAVVLLNVRVTGQDDGDDILKTLESAVATLTKP